MLHQQSRLESVSSKDIKQLKYKPINGTCEFKVRGRITNLRMEDDEVIASFDVEKIKYVDREPTTKEALSSSYDKAVEKPPIVRSDSFTHGGA